MAVRLRDASPALSRFTAIPPVAVVADVTVLTSTSNDPPVLNPIPLDAVSVTESATMSATLSFASSRIWPAVAISVTVPPAVASPAQTSPTVMFPAAAVIVIDEPAALLATVPSITPLASS